MKVSKIIYAVTIILSLGGCTTWVKDEVSHPVTSRAPDYGAVPNKLPRDANGFPEWALPFIRDFEIYGINTYFELTNTVRMPAKKTKSEENEPLELKVSMFVENTSYSRRIKNITGDLFLSSAKMLHPIAMHIYPGSFCTASSEAETVDLRNKEVDLVKSSTEDRVFHARENFKLDGDVISTINACMVFKYSQPVPVSSVFNINFGDVLLTDGELKPLSATFYPIIINYIKK